MPARLRELPSVETFAQYEPSDQIEMARCLVNYLRKRILHHNAPNPFSNLKWVDIRNATAEERHKFAYECREYIMALRPPREVMSVVRYENHTRRVMEIINQMSAPPPNYPQANQPQVLGQHNNADDDDEPILVVRPDPKPSVNSAKIELLPQPTPAYNFLFTVNGGTVNINK